MKVINDVNSLFEIEPYRFYMLDYSPSQEVALYYYAQRNDIDNYKTAQHIKKIFIDIEVFTEFTNKFPEPKDADRPINAVTLINDLGDINVLFLKYEDHDLQIDELKKYLLDKLSKEYNFNAKDLNVYIFDNENDLLISLWKIIHEYDPAILVGFNSDYFDFPYIINRTIKLFGIINATNLITKFGEFKINGFEISIPEFQLVDILKMYKPGEGFGFGKNLDKFNLDTVAQEELGFTKVKHEENLDDMYVNRPNDFILYNIVDTYLIYLLDKKLRHFELFNSQRRIAYSTVSNAYHGRSIMGEQIQTYNILTKENKVPRSFIVKEKYGAGKTEDEFKKFSLSLMYYGAYVKIPKRKLYTGLITDFDQTSMYPSLIKMYNLEYSTYVAKIYDPSIQQFMNILKNIIDNKDRKLLEKLLSKINEKITYYVKNVRKVNNATKYIKLNNEFVNQFITTIFESGISFNDLISNKDYYLFKTKLIPLLETVELVLSKHEYNQIVYDYLMNDDFFGTYKDKQIFVYVNPTDSNSYIHIVNVEQLFETYLKNYIVTISGSLFKKHSDYTGYIIELINTLMKERKELKNKLKDLDPRSKEYELADRNQTSIKVFLNSLYGIYGLSTYRYNEKNIANSITLSGRLLLKTAQVISEQVIKQLFD